MSASLKIRSRSIGGWHPSRLKRPRLAIEEWLTESVQVPGMAALIGFRAESYYWRKRNRQ